MTRYSPVKYTDVSEDPTDFITHRQLTHPQHTTAPGSQPIISVLESWHDWRWYLQHTPTGVTETVAPAVDTIYLLSVTTNTEEAHIWHCAYTLCLAITGNQLQRPRDIRHPFSDMNLK